MVVTAVAERRPRRPPTAGASPPRPTAATAETVEPAGGNGGGGAAVIATASDVPEGGGVILDDPAVVITQPSSGSSRDSLQSVRTRLHGRQRFRRHHQLPVPRQPVLYRGRERGGRSGNVTAAGDEGHRSGQRHLPGLRQRRATAVSAAARRVGAWPIPRPIAPPPGRSRTRPASTVSATPRAGHLRRQGQVVAISRLVVLPGPRRTCTSARRRWCEPRRPSSGRLSRPRSRRCSWSTPGSRSSTPRFNVKYRDDKSYPWLAVTIERGVPAGHGRARRQEEGGALLRAVLPRVGDPRDRRPAACGCSRCVRARRASSSAALRSAGRACSATSANAPRPASARDGGGASRDRRGFLQLHRGPDQSAHQATRTRDERRPPTHRSTSGPPGSATISAR